MKVSVPTHHISSLRFEPMLLEQSGELAHAELERADQLVVELHDGRRGDVARREAAAARWAARAGEPVGLPAVALEAEPAERPHARERHVGHPAVEAAVHLDRCSVERHPLALVYRDRPRGLQRDLQPVADALADHLALQEHREHQELPPIVEAHARHEHRTVPAAAETAHVVAAAAVAARPFLELL